MASGRRLMCTGASVWSPSGAVDLNVVRGDVLPSDLLVAWVGIPGPAGDGGFHAYRSVIRHILT